MALLGVICYERLVRLGPLLTWKAGKDGIPQDRRFAARTRAAVDFPLLVINTDSIIEGFRHLRALFAGALAGYRLFRRPQEKVVESLQRLGRGSSARRVAVYLADLALVGESRRLRMILAGLNLQDLGEATSLPRSTVENALSDIRAGLIRSNRTQRERHPARSAKALLRRGTTGTITVTNVEQADDGTTYTNQVSATVVAHGPVLGVIVSSMLAVAAATVIMWIANAYWIKPTTIYFTPSYAPYVAVIFITAALERLLEPPIAPSSSGLSRAYAVWLSRVALGSSSSSRSRSVMSIPSSTLR
jgi:hypothetical protein